MFPNPQSALPLPPRPSLERYKKLAKDLVKAAKADAIGDWADCWIRELARLSPIDPSDQSIHDVEEFAAQTMSEKRTVTGAQFVLARSHGFTSWTRFAKHLEEPASKFELAADAIVKGDAAALTRLLRADPKSVRTSSTREHRATLLHYVSANGVEGYRQKTPKNIVEITEILLGAGAKVDATADVYGGGCTTLGLVATSVHPERAGVQESLLQILLDHGASVELESAGNRHSLVMACLANGQLRAAEFLADRGAPLDLVAAGGLGRLETVQGLIDEATGHQLDEAFLYACTYAHGEVVKCFLERGMDLAVHRFGGA